MATHIDTNTFKHSIEVNIKRNCG